MATSVFNLSAVDRIEADVLAEQTQLTTLQTQVTALQAQLTTQSAAIASLTKIITDFVAAVGGGDQPAIDAATTELRSLSATLRASVERDKAL
jgi:capsule polysaccharide export protein KpsE/RkpR